MPTPTKGNEPSRTVPPKGHRTGGRFLAVAAGVAVALTGLGISGASAAGPVIARLGANTGPTCRVTINGVSGTLTAINGGTLTIHSDKDGSDKTVTTSATTNFVRITAATIADVHNGDRVLVFGTAANGTIEAKNVLEPQSNGAGDRIPGQGPADRLGIAFGLAAGTVADKTASGFTVITHDGSRAPVTTSADTKITKADRVGLGELRIGERTSAVGQPGENGSLAASNVVQGAENAGTIRVPVPSGLQPPTAGGQPVGEGDGPFGRGIPSPAEVCHPTTR